MEETKKGFDDSRPPWKSRMDIGFNLLDRSTGRNSRTKGRIDCHRLMRKSQERAGQQWHVLYGKTGKSRHLDASMEGATRDFMSRNSLGSPTFMFYPVIMMSTYTLDKTKHYLTSFLFVGIRSSSFLASSVSNPVVYQSTSSLLVIEICPRRGNASHFWDRYEILRTVSVILSPLFRAWNAYRYDTRYTCVSTNIVIDVFEAEDNSIVGCLSADGSMFVELRSNVLIRRNFPFVLGCPRSFFRFVRW